MTFPELGIPFDGEGNAQLLVDDRLAVNLARHDEEGFLTLAAPVAAELPESTTYAQMLDLLDLALGPLFGGSPAVGRDPVSGQLIAYASVPYARLTEASWPEMLGAFVAFADGMARKLM